jgi:hypothetical protein
MATHSIAPGWFSTPLFGIFGDRGMKEFFVGKVIEPTEIIYRIQYV